MSVVGPHTAPLHERTPRTGEEPVPRGEEEEQQHDPVLCWQRDGQPIRKRADPRLSSQRSYTPAGAKRSSAEISAVRRADIASIGERRAMRHLDDHCSFSHHLRALPEFTSECRPVTATRYLWPATQFDAGSSLRCRSVSTAGLAYGSPKEEAHPRSGSEARNSTLHVACRVLTASYVDLPRLLRSGSARGAVRGAASQASEE